MIDHEETINHKKGVHAINYDELIDHKEKVRVSNQSIQAYVEYDPHPSLCRIGILNVYS